jgi:hypothetical protein
MKSLVRSLGVRVQYSVNIAFQFLESDLFQSIPGILGNSWKMTFLFPVSRELQNGFLVETLLSGIAKLMGSRRRHATPWRPTTADQ